MHASYHKPDGLPAANLGVGVTLSLTQRMTNCYLLAF